MAQIKQEGKPNVADSIPVLQLLKTYIVYIILLGFGHLRDYLGNKFYRKQFKSMREHNVSSRHYLLFRVMLHLPVILTHFTRAAFTADSVTAGIGPQRAFRLGQSLFWNETAKTIMKHSSN